MIAERESEIGRGHAERGHVEGAQAVAAAVMQMELALREGQSPVDRLGLLVEGMSETIRELQAAQAIPTGGDGAQPAERLQKDLFLFITQLQFYDRLVQHLTHLQNFLASVAGELASPSPSGGERDVWDEFRVKLRTRLISAAQRELLDATLSPGAGIPLSSDEVSAEYAAAGGVDLF